MTSLTHPVGRVGYTVAQQCDAATVEVEIVCSDEVEHRRRMQARGSDVPGLVKPTWAEVTSRDYEVWGRDHLVVDSARNSIEQAASLVAAAVSSAGR